MTTYINLTGPVMLGIAYFTCAKIYYFAAGKVLEKSAVMSSVASEGQLYAALMLIQVSEGMEPSGEKAIAVIRRSLDKHGIQVKNVETIKGAQKGIWGLFEGTIAVSWTCAFDDVKKKRLILDEAKKVEEASVELRKAGDEKTGVTSLIFHEGRIDGGRHARAGWTYLVGEALMRLNKKGRTDT